MRMNMKQTKLVGLTMELELKTKIYRKLCEKLEEYKKSKIDENDPKLLELKEMFEVNNKQITEINRKIKDLQDDKNQVNEETDIKETYESYNPNKLFDEFKNEADDTKIIEASVAIVNNEHNIFKRIWDKIKRFLNKTS